MCIRDRVVFPVVCSPQYAWKVSLPFTADQCKTTDREITDVHSERVSQGREETADAGVVDAATRMQHRREAKSIADLRHLKHFSTTVLPPVRSSTSRTST